jgi:hypothetical protein
LGEFLDRDAILREGEQRKGEFVLKLPEWQEDGEPVPKIRFLEMGADAVSDFETWSYELLKKSGMDHDKFVDQADPKLAFEMQLRLFMACAVDIDGNRLFSDEDRDAVKDGKFKALFSRVWTDLLELNGIGSKEEAKIMGNSPETEGDGSPSVSASPSETETASTPTTSSGG